MNADNSARRIHDLIEEIRADIDFELDDAVTEILRNLPEEYFSTIKHENLIVHLKALVASRICSIQGEMFVPCDSGNQIAVIGRQNYRGQLANILDQLPAGRTIVRANVFTSNECDFIIDVFDLESVTENSPEQPHATIDPSLVATLVGELNISETDAERFINSFDSFQPGEKTPARLPHLYVAWQKLAETPIVIHWWPKREKLAEQDGQAAAVQTDAEQAESKFTIAVRHDDEKLVFQKAARLLSKHSVDILHAKMGTLNRIPSESSENKTILLTFKIASHDGSDVEELSDLAGELETAING